MTLITSAGYPSYVDQNTSLAGTNTTVFNIPVASDPRIAGLAAGLGSTAFKSDGLGNPTAWFCKKGAANTAWEKYDPGSFAWAGTNFGFYMDRSKALMGSDNITEYFTDFNENNYYFFTLSGAPLAAQFDASEVYIYHSSTGAGYFGRIPAIVTGLPLPWPDNAFSASYPWYVAGRFQTAAGLPLNNTWVSGCGLIGASNAVYVVGINGTVSSGASPKFVCTIGGVTTLSTVTVTENQTHLLEIWNNASGTFFSVDRETPIPVGSVTNEVTRICAYSSIVGTAPNYSCWSNLFGAYAKMYGG